MKKQFKQILGVMLGAALLAGSLNPMGGVSAEGIGYTAQIPAAPASLESWHPLLAHESAQVESAESLASLESAETIETIETAGDPAFPESAETIETAGDPASTENTESVKTPVSPKGAAPELDNTGNGDEPEYIVPDESDFRLVSPCAVAAGSYTAEVNFSAVCNYNYRSLMVLYSDSPDADFFPGEASVTEAFLEKGEGSAKYYKFTYPPQNYMDSKQVNGEEILTYSLDVPGNNTAALRPNTEYKYRVAAEIYDHPDYRLAFVTPPLTFTTGSVVTESQVTVANVEIEESGYFKDLIGVQFSNPGNESIRKVEIVEKADNDDDAVVQCTLYYDEEKKLYEGKVYKSEKPLQLRAGVFVGDNGTLTYIKKDLQLTFRDENKMTEKSVTASANGFTIVAEAQVSPCYTADDLKVRVYYKISTATSFSKSDSYLDKDGYGFVLDNM